MTLPFLRAPGARSTGAPKAPNPPAALTHTTPLFDGFPYLVTRIGRTALRHLAVVPATWPRDRLVELATRQATTNRLETCLCLGPADAAFVSPAGVAREAAFVPTGLPVVDRLVIAAPLPETAELAERREALRAYARRWRGDGHIVGDGLEGGRLATPTDIDRLTGPAVDGLPRGLRRCLACGELRGERLRDEPLRIEPLRIERLRGAAASEGDERPEVVDVFCRCANRNHCAGCGGLLAEHRLSARYWDEADARAWYVAAYCGLGHRCAGGSPTSRADTRRLPG